MLPDLGELPGGVARHINDLKQHMVGVEWTNQDPDLVHTHASERAPRVDVYTNHGVYPADSAVPWQTQINARIFDNLRLARRVIAVSNWTWQQWAPAAPYVQPYIIPNGVDLDLLDSIVPDGLPELSVPYLVWGKMNVSQVLDPAPALRIALDYPDHAVVTFLRPGTIPGAPDNFYQLGSVSHRRALEILAGARALIASTQENCPIQVLEAMALGTPIIGYDHAGTGEILRGSTIAKLATWQDEDELSHLVNFISQCDTLAGKELVRQKYDIKLIAEQTKNVYRLAMLERIQELASPKVAVVVTCHNKGAYIEETLQSVINQTGAPPMELIVVDDGSTDDSLAKIEAMLDKAHESGNFEQTILLSNSEPVRVCAARNSGIRAARAPYIISLDGDDLIHPEYVRIAASVLDGDPAAGIAYPDMLQLRNGMLASSGGQEYSLADLAKQNFIPCAAMFRRKAWQQVGGYNDAMNEGWEDYEFWLHQGIAGWYGRRIPIPLFTHRQVMDGRDRDTWGHDRRLHGLVHRLHRDVFKPVVSVIIPCYKHSHFLLDAIKSVQDQYFSDWEIIVVDDGNEPDEASAIAAICALTGSRLVRLDKNSGLAAARNAGIREAAGQYILPLDADDRLGELALAEMVDALEAANGEAFAYGDWIAWDGEQTEVHEAGPWGKNITRQLNIPCTILYPKSVWEKVGGYSWEMSRAGGWEDWDYLLSLAEMNVPSVKIKVISLYYRQHSAEQMRLTADSNKSRLREMLRRRHPHLYHKDW